MLSLASIFNDLKDIYWFDLQLQKFSEVKSELSAITGQLAGMQNHLKRTAIGICNELLKLIKARKEKFECEKIKCLIEALPQNTQKRWIKLIAVSCEDDVSIKNTTSDKFRDTLRSIRNTISFHYGDFVGWKMGFEKHFSPNELSEIPIHKQYAYYSDGENMEQTRFYYADAAADGFLKSQGIQWDHFISDFLK